MSKRNSFEKYLKNISVSINNLLEKNLNRLNFNNLRILLINNKIIITIVAFIVLFISYLLLPTFYSQSDISKELKMEILEKYNLNINFTKRLNYNFFPRPYFETKESNILDRTGDISQIKKIKIYVSLDNLFSLKNLEVNDLIIENANFNLTEKNYNFFTQILDNNFSEIKLKIKNSNVFFRNNNKEVLFLNKILDMKYYYDPNELKNILNAKNEIFNLPYTIELFKNHNKKIIFSKINFSFLKLQIKNELTYQNDLKVGNIDFIFNKNKSKSIYQIKKNLFEFKFFDKLNDYNFLFEGKFNFKPFYSSLKGRSNELDISYLFNSNSVFKQLLKTEIFNNKNIDFKMNIIANQIYNNLNFENVDLKLKIQDGLIDVDETIFQWRDFSNFKLKETLIFVNQGELVLDGKLEIIINNYDEIYKYLLTPKNYRNEIKKIDLNFTYNFDQKIANLKDIKIDGKINQNVNIILNNLILKSDNLHNKIYFKNLLNEAIKNYAG